MKIGTEDFLDSLKFAFNLKSVFENMILWAVVLLLMGVIAGASVIIGGGNLLSFGFTFIGVALLCVLAIIVIGIAVNIAIVREAYNKKKSFMSEFKLAGDRLLPFIGYSLVITALNLISNLVLSVIPFVGNFISMIANFFVSLVVMFTPVYILIKKTSVVDSLKKSGALFEKYTIDVLAVFGIHLVLVALAMIGIVFDLIVFAGVALLILGAQLGLAFTTRNFGWLLNPANIVIVTTLGLLFVTTVGMICVMLNRATTAVIVSAFKKLKA